MIYQHPRRKSSQTFNETSKNLSEALQSVDRDKVRMTLKAILLLTGIACYVTVTVLSYAISPMYFWTLIKAGVVLGLLGFIKANM